MDSPAPAMFPLICSQSLDTVDAHTAANVGVVANTSINKVTMRRREFMYLNLPHILFNGAPSLCVRQDFRSQERPPPTITPEPPA